MGAPGRAAQRATIVVIMGDGRNNRLPARADLLREIGRFCRAVIWLIPEERERWGTGDSAIFQYAREVSALVPSRNLRELEDALSAIGLARDQKSNSSRIFASNHRCGARLPSTRRRMRVFPAGRGFARQ